ncbi:MAG: NlpC/P60 family protein [candidate division WOR-3 bacterium]|nr:NlpC/P60 family protein [candidate division WOR-3 bacterium]
MIFFPGHVGMYCGNNEFIHASLSNGGVAMSTLSGKFLVIRRMVCTT